MKPSTMLFVIAAVPLIGLPGWSQHNSRVARDLQFRFGNPGARSLGFGGAFIGLADDATAPVVNPAGMSRTTKRSASFELNYNRVENDIPFQSGTLLQTNIFEFDYDFNQSSAPENILQAPFLSAVFPKEQWRFGIFAQQQANLKRQYRTEDIIICPIGANFYPDCVNDPNPAKYPPSTDILDLEIVNYGVSVGHQFGERFSIGVSAFLSDLDYRADSEIEFPQIADVVLVRKLANGNDQDWGLIGGMLWQITDELSMGITYKRQPEFTYTAELISERPVSGVPPDFQTTGIFDIPDSLGLGVSIRPLDRVTINLDANRVYYSEITDHLIDFAQIEDIVVLQTMPDVTELHIGFEWIFARATFPVSLRLGYWLDPYHAATNNIDDSQLLEGTSANPSVRDIFFLHRFEEDQNHYSLGLGWTFSEKFQFDVALETSENEDNGTVSGIYRF